MTSEWPSMAASSSATQKCNLWTCRGRRQGQLFNRFIGLKPDTDQQAVLPAQHFLRLHPVLSSSQVFSAPQRQRLSQIRLSGDSRQGGRRPQRGDVVLLGDDFGCVKTGSSSEVTGRRR